MGTDSFYGVLTEKAALVGCRQRRRVHMSQLKARFYSLARPQTLRIAYVLVVIAALALVAGAPMEWGGGGPH